MANHHAVERTIPRQNKVSPSAEAYDASISQAKVRIERLA